MKKQISIRVEQDHVDSLGQIAIKEGVYHPLTKALPNVAQLINCLIDSYIALHASGVSLQQLQSAEFRAKVAELAKKEGE